MLLAIHGGLEVARWWNLVTQHWWWMRAHRASCQQGCCLKVKRTNADSYLVNYRNTTDWVFRWTHFLHALTHWDRVLVKLRSEYFHHRDRTGCVASLTYPSFVVAVAGAINMPLGCEFRIAKTKKTALKLT